MPKILVVDDDKRMLGLLTATLPSGYEVTQASDGEKAMVLIEEEPPELMLLDVNMPGMSGLDVLREVRASPALRGIRVIMVTARSDPEDQGLGLRLGADAYLTKPFSPRALLDTITRLLA